MIPTALTATAASALAVRAPGLTTALAAGSSPNGTWFNNSAIQRRLWPATIETLEMTLLSGGLTIILGLLLGLALISTGKRGQHPNRFVYEALSQIVNIGRSMPFIILMVAILPLTRMLGGTSTTARSRPPS